MTRTAVHPPSSHSWILGLLYVALYGMSGMGVAVADSARDPLVLRGKQLARMACSGCHVVTSDSESPSLLQDPAPRFDEIASRPGTSERSLQQFITTTHWDGETSPITMPRPELTKQQIVAFSWYIMSLRKR